ncbi:sensor histidine kinase [Pollutibacter soli]|uniref:sensor histidine kinase n=1 Tax=Pollutibacter soli TaxID=3034157 RepID=UPI003013D8D5
MESPWYSKKWFTVLLHVVVWVFIFSLPFLLRGPNPKEAANRFADPGYMTSYVVRFLSWIFIFYFNALFLIPRYFYQKKFAVFTACHVAIYLATLLLGKLMHDLLTPKEYFAWVGHFIIMGLVYIFYFAVSTMYQLIRDREETDRKNKEKLTENLKTELSLLRSQVSPHFMFNVLNNMVALARKKSDLLEPSLIKLSSLMRYMIYEADEEKVPLEKEVEYLQSYIDLQQQRFGKNVHVQVNVSPFDKAYEIEPMLLIPFVENAFKHGTGMIMNAMIHIDLNVDKGILYFTVKNKFNPESSEIKDKSSGIGLTNVKRRLNLLYQNQHSLKIDTKDDYFTILLEVKLH